MEIYWISGSPNAWRALLAAEIKGLPYESKLLDFSKGETKTPAFLALNPRGKVPVIRDDDFVLYESVPILEYLGSKPGSSEATLYGRNPRDAANVRRAISEFESYQREPLAKTSAALLAHVGLAPASRALEPKVLEETIAAMRTELDKLEGVASRDAWLAGDRVSAADAAVYPFLRLHLRALEKSDARARELGLAPFEARYAKLATWMKRVEGLPGYDRTYPPHWR